MLMQGKGIARCARGCVCVGVGVSVCVCACVCCTIGQAKARAALRISAFSQLPSCLRSWLLMAEGVVDVPAAAVAVAAAYAVLDMFRLPTPLP